MVEYLCFLFKAFGDGVDLKYKNLEISQTVENDGLLLFFPAFLLLFTIELDKLNQSESRLRDSDWSMSKNVNKLSVW